MLHLKMFQVKANIKANNAKESRFLNGPESLYFHANSNFKIDINFVIYKEKDTILH